MGRRKRRRAHPSQAGAFHLRGLPPMCSRARQRDGRPGGLNGRVQHRAHACFDTIKGICVGSMLDTLGLSCSRRGERRRARHVAVLRRMSEACGLLLGIGRTGLSVGRRFPARCLAKHNLNKIAAGGGPPVGAALGAADSGEPARPQSPRSVPAFVRHDARRLPKTRRGTRRAGANGLDDVCCKRRQRRGGR